MKTTARYLNVAYTYLYHKSEGDPAFHRKILKMLWWANKRSLTRWDRTITGGLLPIVDLTGVKLENLKVVDDNLSISDTKELDKVFNHFLDLSDDDIENFEITDYQGISEIFPDKMNARRVVKKFRSDQIMDFVFGGSDDYVFDGNWLEDWRTVDESGSDQDPPGTF